MAKNFLGGLNSLVEPLAKPTLEEESNIKIQTSSSINPIEENTQEAKTQIEKNLSSKKNPDNRKEGTHPNESLIAQYLEKEPAIEIPTLPSSNSILEKIQELNTQIEEKKPIKTKNKGVSIGEERFTFIINEKVLESFRALAYWERKPVKEVMGNILTKYLNTLDQTELLKAKKLFIETKKGRE